MAEYNVTNFVIVNIEETAITNAVEAIADNEKVALIPISGGKQIVIFGYS